MGPIERGLSQMMIRACGTLEALMVEKFPDDHPWAQISVRTDSGGRDIKVMLWPGSKGPFDFVGPDALDKAVRWLTVDQAAEQAATIGCRILADGTLVPIEAAHDAR